MKKTLITMSAALLYCVTAVSYAQDGPVILGPATGGVTYAAPIADGQLQPVPAGPVEAVSLFHCVRVKDPHHIHPCAVPIIIQVADPCESSCDPCDSCCAPKCVNVQICVPPCGCPPKIKSRKDGHYVKYDYGRYRIRITSRRGVVTVNYDD